MKYKVVLLDIDGVFINSGKFTERFSQQYGTPVEKMMPFFKGNFQLCLLDKLDLKEELEKVKGDWGFTGSVDALMKFWFEGEASIDQVVLRAIGRLSQSGFIVVGAANQEKYRTQYLQDQLKLNDIFDKMYISVQMEVKKPDAEFYLKIAQDQKVDFNEIVYWDDDVSNVEKACGLGIKAYLFQDDAKFVRQLQDDLNIRI